ncbi:hypothetical protein AVEN_270783-1 [Araneus ventricosus]|uniref:Uncharacterized protein n=1 Tax=Araneus ventricosus TaxID=182803 RepID=A0A4Y2I0G7_ARAVE|nr:hypothetical protein AVEN_270783-1 [Araneus ventricosus]
MEFRTNDPNRWNSNEIKFQQFMCRFPFETPTESKAAHQRTCLDWNLATRLENRKSDEWGRNRGNRRAAVGVIFAPAIAIAVRNLK